MPELFGAGAAEVGCGDDAHEAVLVRRAVGRLVRLREPAHKRVARLVMTEREEKLVGTGEFG